MRRVGTWRAECGPPALSPYTTINLNCRHAGQTEGEHVEKSLRDAGENVNAQQGAEDCHRRQRRGQSATSNGCEHPHCAIRRNLAQVQNQKEPRRRADEPMFVEVPWLTR